MLQSLYRSQVQLSGLGSFWAPLEPAPGPNPLGVQPEVPAPLTYHPWGLSTSQGLIQEPWPPWGPDSKFQFLSRLWPSLSASLLHGCPNIRLSYTTCLGHPWSLSQGKSPPHGTVPGSWPPGKEGLSQGPRGAHRMLPEFWSYWGPVQGSRPPQVTHPNVQASSVTCPSVPAVPGSWPCSVTCLGSSSL